MIASVTDTIELSHDCCIKTKWVPFVHGYKIEYLKNRSLVGSCWDFVGGIPEAFDIKRKFIEIHRLQYDPEYLAKYVSSLSA